LPIKNAVSFHSSIEKAERNKELQHHITETYQYDAIDSYTVSSKIPTTRRNVLIQEFANSSRKALITNSKCLTEGVDVPNIDCIVFADPRKSKVDIVQALGRALRKKEGKAWGYVILPVVYDDITHEIDNENYAEIISIIRGLASNDERIIEYFKEKGDKTGTKRVEGSSLFDFNFSAELLDEKDLTAQLQIKIWENLSKFQWMPFEEAREFVRGLNFKSSAEYIDFWRKGKLPDNIPSKPRKAYSDNGFISMPDFLGYESRFQEWMSFKEAREYVRSLGLKSTTEYKKIREDNKLPINIPGNPRKVYEKDWISIGDWLGTGKVADNLKNYRNFEEAREYIRSLNLSSGSDYLKLWRENKLPDDFPAKPEKTYKNSGFISIPDFLGYESRFQQWLSYDEAKEFSRNLKLNSNKDWREFSKTNKKPINIPSSPDKIYKDKGWNGWKEWLGSEEKRLFRNDVASFYDARKFARNLKLKNVKEWILFCKTGNKPNDIPSKPQVRYEGIGWKGWADFLGKEE
jgi:hypothetical protein